ncbi:MAG: ion transporter [Dehalococcoidia bacterium]
MEQQPNDDNKPNTVLRWEFLAHLDAVLERPLLGLSAVWLVLMVMDLTVGLGPVLLGAMYGIWALFILDALVELAIAPDRIAHLKQRWYVFLALAVPALRPLAAFRSFTLLRTARVVRPAALARVLTGLNRGMQAVRDVGESKGVGYVLALTFVVTFGGAAGMYWLEGAGPGATADSGFGSFADAVWWTAMLLTTIGPDFFPQTLEGRVLAWFLALYGLAVFGYLTAAIASYLVGRDKRARKEQEANALALREQLALLHERLDALQRQQDRAA